MEKYENTGKNENNHNKHAYNKNVIILGSVLRIPF